VTEAAAEPPAEYQCPECAEQGVFTPFPTKQALGMHRRRAHGIVGESHQRKSHAAKGKKRGPYKPRKVKPVSDLDVDDIFYSVIKTLYPGGKVPVEHLQELLTWRDQTAALLETLVSS